MEENKEKAETETNPEKEEPKETAEVEVVDKDKEEEKKEGGFKKFWKGIKKSADDSILESKIDSSYRKAHRVFNTYSHKTGMFNSSSVYGEIKDNVLSYWGDDAIEEGTVIIDSKDKKAYYAKDSKPITLSSEVEGTVYERKGVAIALDENVEEVDVIKADDRYFIYKGKKEEKKEDK